MVTLDPEKRESIVDKIQKLIALTSSSNEHEAALAAERVAAMLLKYNLDMSEVEEQTGKKEAYIRRYYTNPSKSPTFAFWQDVLINGIAKNNFCSVVRITDGKRLTRTHSFIGKESNIEVCIYLFEYLNREIERLAQEAWMETGIHEVDYDDEYEPIPLNAKKWKNEFGLGATQIVCNRLNKQRETAKQEPTTMALVVTVDAELKQAVSTFYTSLKPGKSRTMNSTAYNIGQRRGLDIPIHDGLKHTQEPVEALR